MAKGIVCDLQIVDIDDKQRPTTRQFTAQL